ncbi:hypothetical protein AXG93_4905s1240 [Marchantia polymorpha subsp. ruderalis]|uniref:Uncharacterized protein n=1 Tax=Marchantia polymorpha subsp. ruderalis TaxID=1480154 RepID=A0A176VHN8_MARPO|nr:hypothetical protein AXG93_4905s1240 [Marchantia polymorpha subsp. ruderalis]
MLSETAEIRNGSSCPTSRNVEKLSADGNENQNQLRLQQKSRLRVRDGERYPMDERVKMKEALPLVDNVKYCEHSRSMRSHPSQHILALCLQLSEQKELPNPTPSDHGRPPCGFDENESMQFSGVATIQRLPNLQWDFPGLRAHHCHHCSPSYAEKTKSRGSSKCLNLAPAREEIHARLRCKWGIDEDGRQLGQDMSRNTIKSRSVVNPSRRVFRRPDSPQPRKRGALHACTLIWHHNEKRIPGLRHRAESLVMAHDGSAPQSRRK